jgi:hypothetical protein
MPYFNTERFRLIVVRWQESTLKTLKFDVFGRSVLVAESGDGWAAFYLGAEGKKRPAKDIVVPADIPESEIEQYLGDLCHEWATEQHPYVKRLD